MSEDAQFSKEQFNYQHFEHSMLFFVQAGGRQAFFLLILLVHNLLKFNYLPYEPLPCLLAASVHLEE